MIMCSSETFNSVLFFGFGASRFIFYPLRALLREETESRLDHVRRPRGLADEDEGIVNEVLVSGSDTQ
jgi:fructoselysine-6-P-deglycase FrlB-like protein